MDPKTILKTLKDASPFDLFLISFIALPFVFEAWLRVLEKLELGLCAMYWSLGIVLLGYIVGVVAMLVGSNREKRREVAKDQVIGYLTTNSYKMMAFETIREKINQGYTNDFLNSLPIYFPNEIRRATLKGNKSGLARIVEESDENKA